mgnify:CR=1 FL=1
MEDRPGGIDPHTHFGLAAGHGPRLGIREFDLRDAVLPVEPGVSEVAGTASGLTPTMTSAHCASR